MQLCCILLLLFAQQTTLTHAIWHHAGGEQDAHLERGHAHAQEGGDAHDEGHSHEGGFQSELCVYHIALGESVGVNVGTAPMLSHVDAPAAPDHVFPTGRSRAEAVAAVSRGPPILL